MSADVDVLRTFERAPLRTLRPTQLQNVTSHPGRTVARLVQKGALVRIAAGVYTAPPAGRDGHTWKPTIEAAGLAVATARFGNRQAILMGLGAARHWKAIPRAIGVTVVAVPVAGRPPVHLDHGGVAHFIPRRLERIDAALEPTELGQGLVATPAQTLFDLLMKPRQGGEADLAAEAARNITPQVDAVEFDEIVARAEAGINDKVRAAQRQLETTGR